MASSARLGTPPTNADLLTALDGVEQAFDQSDLHSRFAARRRARLLSSVDIVDCESAYREEFKNLNLKWLNKHFTVEPVDREILWNPELILEDGGLILFAKVDSQIVGTCAHRAT